MSPEPPPPPYRDDRAALVAENARLRADLARRGRGPRWTRVVAVALVLGLDVLAFELVRSLVNAPSDARAFGGMALAALVIAAHVPIALRLARPPEG